MSSDLPAFSRFQETDPVESVIRVGETLEREEVPQDELVRMVRKPMVHDKLRDHVLRMLDFSEREMARFHGRWKANELRMQAYINRSDAEQLMKERNDAGEVPSAIKIVVPFGYAAVATYASFYLHTFTTRKPLFHIGAYNDESVEPAKNMEMKLQYDATKTRLTKELYQGYVDAGIYGFMAHKITWAQRSGMRTFMDENGEKFRERTIVYEGNDVEALDPYKVFPDPRVPMSKVSEKGEFFFWRTEMARADALKLQADGEFFDIERVTKTMPKNENCPSSRSILAHGADDPAHDTVHGESQPQTFIQLDQGTILLIPKDYKLGTDDTPRRFLVTIANKDRIIGIQEWDTDTDRHPVEIAEPHGTGYTFGSASPMDYVGPIQDMLSWILNSRIANVRTTLNNMWVVDPLRVIMSDIAKPTAGKMIRLKDTAFGTDVRSAVQQLVTIDVTSGHFKDFELMLTLGQMLLALNENIMGQPQTGGRKTATEIRVSGEAAVSRMSASARIISAQSHTPMGEQMAMNNMQFLSPEFAVRVLGSNKAPTQVTGQNIMGDFEFPVHDGTLPLDRAALADVWKEILFGVGQDPELRQTYDFARIFENVAEIAGAQDIQNYRRLPQGAPGQVGLAPDEQVLNQAADGDLVGIQQILGGGGV